MIKNVTVVLLALLGLTGPIGCGDDTPSREEFVADLNAICKETNAKVARLDSPRVVKEIPKFTRESRAIVDESLDKAEELELPEEDRDGFKDYISKSRQSVATLDELEQAAKKNDEKAVRRILVKAAEDNNRRDAQAKALGLRQCGNTSRG